MIYSVLVVFHDDFVKVDGNDMTVGLMKKPVRGEAKKELVKKIAKHFGISSSKVKIKAGIKSRAKMIEILS